MGLWLFTLCKPCQCSVLPFFISHCLWHWNNRRPEHQGHTLESTSAIELAHQKHHVVFFVGDTRHNERSQESKIPNRRKYSATNTNKTSLPLRQIIHDEILDNYLKIITTKTMTHLPTLQCYQQGGSWCNVMLPCTRLIIMDHPPWWNFSEAVFKFYKSTH